MPRDTDIINLVEEIGAELDREAQRRVLGCWACDDKGWIRSRATGRPISCPHCNERLHEE